MSSGQEAADQRPRERLERAVPAASVVLAAVVVVLCPRRQGRVRGDLLETPELFVRVRAEARREVADETVGREARNMGPGGAGLSPVLVLPAARLRWHEVVGAVEPREEVRGTLIGVFNLTTKELYSSGKGNMFSC